MLPTAAGGPASPNPNPLCTDPTQTCQTSATPLTIVDNGTKHAWSFSVYLQDEWKVLPQLTVNYGVRYDQYGAFSRGDQVSPRVNAVWTPLDGTIVHAGYSRYFSPPPIELVASTDIALFDNTTSAPATTHGQHAGGRAGRLLRCRRSPSRSATQLKVGVDSFFKTVEGPDRRRPVRRADRPDAVQLCAWTAVWRANSPPIIRAAISPPMPTSPMITRSGEDWVTSQFNFDPDDIAYVQNHYIHLDHEQ